MQIKQQKSVVGCPNRQYPTKLTTLDRKTDRWQITCHVLL